jgi:hypothetical protein
MRWKGRRQAAALVGTLQLFTACYQYVPVQSAPAVGSQVALEINDDGRVALRAQLGPGVVRLEGRVSAVDGDDMVVETSSVTQIRGRPVPVDSVRVRVSQGHVERMDERRLSQSRTWMVIGGAVAIVAAFFVGKGVFGHSTPSDDPPGGPPINQYRGQ